MWPLAGRVWTVWPPILSRLIMKENTLDLHTWFAKYCNCSGPWTNLSLADPVTTTAMLVCSYAVSQPLERPSCVAFKLIFDMEWNQGLGFIAIKSLKLLNILKMIFFFSTTHHTDWPTEWTNIMTLTITNIDWTLRLSRSDIDFVFQSSTSQKRKIRLYRTLSKISEMNVSIKSSPLCCSDSALYQ